MPDRRRSDAAKATPSAPRELPEQFGEQIEDHLRRTQLAGLFLQSPSFMAVTRGEEHVFVNVNPTYRELVGGRELIGRTAREAFPDLEGQGFLELLDRVYETGEPYVGSEERVRLRRGDEGEWSSLFLCFSYHPLRDDEGNVTGVLHHGIDVTERVELRRHLRRRVRQQAAVADLGRSALEATDLTEVLRRASKTARDVLDADAVVLYRMSGEGEVLARTAAADGQSTGEAPSLAVEGDHVPGRAFREGSPVFERIPDSAARRRSIALTGARLQLAVPIPASEGEPLGILLAEAAGAGAFTEEDVPILEAIAQTAGAAIVREEGRRFRNTVAKNLPGILYRCRNDRDWTMELLSEGTRELTGYPPGDLTGEEGPAYADLIHPADRQKVWEQVQAAVRERRPFHLQYRIVTRDGEEKWVWEQGRGVEPATGDPFRLEGYIFDITAWREAEREAGRLDSVLQAAFRGTREAVFVVGLPGRTIVECNRAAEELFGYSREELLGRSTETLHVDAEHHEEFGRESEEALREEGFYRGEFEMKRRDGTVFPTEHSVTYVEGPSEPPGYAVSILRDLTEQKERQARIERSQHLLEEHAAHVTEAREQERAEIAREVHDELGQTLTGLKFQLERIEKEVEEGGDAGEAIRESREILGSVFDQVRALHDSLRPARLDALGLREALAELVERWEETTGLDAEFRYDGPDAGLGGDRDIHVYRVVQEALTNVARHAAADRVVVEAREDDTGWRVRVRDDGVGLDGDGEAPDGHGLLGMRERARLLGGSVRVRDAESGGAEVELRAPAGGGRGDG